MIGISPARRLMEEAQRKASAARLAQGSLVKKYMAKAIQTAKNMPPLNTQLPQATVTTSSMIIPDPKPIPVPGSPLTKLVKEASEAVKIQTASAPGGAPSGGVSYAKPAASTNPLLWVAVAAGAIGLVVFMKPRGQKK